MWKVEKHKRGWAVVHVVNTGLLNGAKTVIQIWPTKKEAETHAAKKPHPDSKNVSA